MGVQLPLPAPLKFIIFIVFQRYLVPLAFDDLVVRVQMVATVRISFIFINL